ncbi:MAG: hypothetical protein ACI835_001700 [Planctomycetota bacterium]|jgi:hypothetical protein
MSKKNKQEAGATDASGAPVDAAALVTKHLRIGWWMVLIYLSMGIALEAMHGLKIGWYLNVANETRRLMFTLAHSHGVLIGVLHLAYAFSAKTLPEAPSKLSSMCLTASGVLLPGGFLLGGIVVYGGDPGKGILLVPVGAAFLLIAVLQTALKTRG